MAKTTGAKSAKPTGAKASNFGAVKSPEAKPKNTMSSSRPTAAQTRKLRDVWDYMDMSWVQAQSAVRKQWHKLTDEDILDIRGKRENLMHKVEMRYGLTEDEAESELDKWAEKVEF